MITITPKAIQKAKEIMVAENLGSEHYLRVNVKGGGCSGFTYDLFFEDTKIDSSQEETYVYDGLTIAVNNLCLSYLDGTEIDYIDQMYGGGFKFNNPGASTTCGCGMSFDAK